MARLEWSWMVRPIVLIPYYTFLNLCNVALEPWILISPYYYTWSIRIGEENARIWRRVLQNVVLDREVVVGIIAS